MSETASRHVHTLHSGSNADVLVDVARLYIPEGALVADVTWGHGIFWQKTDCSRFTLVGSDLDHEVPCIAGPCRHIPTPSDLLADHIEFAGRKLAAQRSSRLRGGLYSGVPLLLRWRVGRGRGFLWRQVL